MKMLAAVLALCFVGGTAMADPSMFVPGTGVPNVVPSGRNTCWSEPADLNGLIGTSEQILAFGLETELANDFIPFPHDFLIIYGVNWWGGFYNNYTPCASGITTPGFNLRLYEDAGCVPGTILADLSITGFTEEYVGCQQGFYPMFKWGAEIWVSVVGGNRYWFGAQMKDHAYPPNAGRLASGGVAGCETMFKSAYYGYPNWTPVVNVFGLPFDCSQEFLCIEGQPVACCINDLCFITTGLGCAEQGGIAMDPPCEPSPCLADSPDPDGALLAVALSLRSPNPTSGPVIYSVRLSQSATARVMLYDAAGRLLQELMKGDLDAGSQTFTWTPGTSEENRTPPGIYFLRLEADLWNSASERVGPGDDPGGRGKHVRVQRVVLVR